MLSKLPDLQKGPVALMKVVVVNKHLSTLRFTGVSAIRIQDGPRF
jgi:hypothetical protein